MARKVGVLFNIKTGGPEARYDIRIASEMAPDVVIASMVESTHAMRKHVAAMKKEGCPAAIGLNIETQLAVADYFNMVADPAFGEVAMVVIGRVDLVGSMGLSRASADSPRVTDMLRTVYTATPPAVTRCLGGALTAASEDVVRGLVADGLLERCETRYVIFDAERLLKAGFSDGLRLAQTFERQWLAEMAGTQRRRVDELQVRSDMIAQRQQESGE